MSSSPSPLLLCKRACEELVRSEETYVATLKTIVEVFLRPLHQWAAETEEKEGRERERLQERSTERDKERDVVTIAELKALFGSVETLLTVNRDLLATLHQVNS